MQDQQGEHEEPMTQRSGNPLQNLKAALKTKWEQKGVDICYQKMVQFYLNDMTPDDAKLQIFREQEKILSNTSPSFKIEKLKQDRIRIIENLKDMIQDQNNIQHACSCLDELRKINLKICESIFSLKQVLNKRDIDGGAVSVGYESFFKQLNSDNQFLLNTYLNQFVNFSNSYDPFFLIPYQEIEAQGFAEDTPQPIVRLFKMNISYVYRLIKMKNQLVKCLNYASIVDRNVTFQLENYGRRELILQNQSKIIRRKLSQEKGHMLRKNKYETIPQESTQIEQGRKLSRKIIKSEPKQRTKSMQSSEEQKSQSKKTLKRIKIKKNLESITNSVPHRLQTVNYEIAEDEDINIFRKKMLARRKRRKMIDLRTNREDDLTNDLSIPIRGYEINRTKKSLGTIELQEYPQQKMSLSTINRQQSYSDPEEQEKLMQPKIIAEPPGRYQRLKLSERVQSKDGFSRRKDRIKLTPLSKNEQQEREQSYESGHSPYSIKLKDTYQPLSPEIKEVNNQSSSGNSDQKQQSSDEAYTGERQHQLFMDVNENVTQAQIPSKPSFRIKKVVNQQHNEGLSAYKSYMQSESIATPEERHGNKFKDGHIRRASITRNQSIGPAQDRQKSPSFRITKKFQDQSQKTKTFDFKNEKQPNRYFDNQKKAITSTFKPIIQVGEPYSGKANINYPNQSVVSKKVQQRILSEIEQQLDDSKNKKKQIQMKPGEIKLADLYSFIEKQKINQIQRDQFQVGLWKQNINLKHSYLTKFYMNSELAAFGLSSPRCDGDYSILYWGTTCPQNFTTFLFRKYLDYLQKFTCLNNIYIGSSGYADSDFLKKGSMYVRKRKNFEKRELPYIPFLSVECSNICFQQQNNNSQSSIFFSQQIQQFSKENAKTSQAIGLCDPSLPSFLSLSLSSNSNSNSNSKAGSELNEGSPPVLPSQSKFHNNLSITQINAILQSSSIDTYATSDKIKIDKCRLFTLKDQCSIKSNYFYVRNGFFIPKGYQIFSKDKQKIIKLEMNKQEYSLYFGKKFANISSFLQNCSHKISGPDHFFAFKMFSKQLYGRLRNPQFEKEGCYGNWDINFLWQDQLKGTVIKDMPQNEYTFGPQSFFVALFKNQVLLFGFQVKPSDFFF